MAGRFDIGPRIGIDGEKEFRDEISRITGNLKTLDTEMTKVVSTFDKGDKSVAALTSQNEILNKKIDEQRQKLATLQKYLSDATQKYGENSKETQKLQQSTNKATAELNDMERELRDNNAAIDEANKKTGKLSDGQDALGKKSVGLGDALNKLAQKFGVTLPEGATNSLNSMVSLDSKMVAMVATTALVAVGLYKVIDALADLTVEQAAVADKTATLSIVSGINTETLQELAYAAELVDTDVSTITDSMSKMIRTMNSARNGTKETEDAYRQLGVQITEGPNKALRDSETVFFEAIDALGRVANETERDALAMILFGRSAKDLNPLIEAGSEKMKEFAQEAHDTGYVLSDEMLKKLTDVDDQMQRFKNSTEAAKNMVAVQFAPSLTRFMEVGQDVFQALSEAAEKSGLLDVFASVLEIISALAPAAETTADILGDVLGGVLKPLALGLAVVADALNIIVSLLALVIESVKWLLGSGNEDRMQRYWGNITNVFSDKGATARTFNSLYGVGSNAAGTDNWRGGLTWVGERGPELLSIPSGAQIFSAAESESISRNSLALPALAGDSFNYGGDVWNISIPAKDIQEFNDIVKIVRNARQNGRAAGGSR